MRGRWVVGVLLVALVTATAAPAMAQTSQDLVGLTLLAAKDQLEQDGLSYQVNGLPEGFDEEDALVATVDVIDSAASVGSVFVLGAGTAVPEVVGRGLADAQQAVRDVGLNPMLDPQPDDATPFDTDGLFVAEQSQDPASLVPFGEDVFLQYGVRVPNLEGLSKAKAEAEAEAGRLELDASGPSGGVVTLQQPQRDEVVRIGSSVAVVLEVPEASVDLVTVPDLRGLSPDTARKRLAEVDLELSPTVEGDPALATANDQTPAPDAQVSRNSTVRVSFAAPVVGDSEGDASGEPPQDDAPSLAASGLLVAVVVLALLVAATLTSRGAVRRRRERRWLREQVRCSPWAGQVMPPQLHELDAAASLTVRAEGRRDPGKQVLEEAHP